MKTWLECFPHWADPVAVHPALRDVLDEGPRDEDELDFARFVDALPKTEVHVHAEAAVPWSFYASLGDGPALPPAGQPFRDFHDFGERWLGNIARIRSSSDYAALARAFVAHRRALHIVATDCHVSLLDTSVYRPRFAPGIPPLDLGESLRAFVTGLREAMAEAPGIDVRVIVDLVHLAGQADLDAAYRALRPFVGSADNRDARGDAIVVGIGLGGPERPGRASFFASALARFRALGLRLDLHSGEQPHVSPADHRAALKLLRPDRVAHGMRGAPEGFFFEGPIAACPISNVLLGGHAGSLSTHPIGEMVRRGLPVSVSTDDPLLFGTTLVIEHVALRRAFGFDRTFVERDQERARAQRLASLRTSPRR
ncbi:MAG: hypothetical protein U0359_01565 [Byssovorax sp.]